MLNKYDPDNSTLHRNRSLFAIEPDLDLELAYFNRQYVIATVTSYEEPIELGIYEFVDLRKFLVDELNSAKEPGMIGFEFEPCAIAKKELSPEDFSKDSPDMVSLKNFSQSRCLRPKSRETRKTIKGEFRSIFARWFDSSAALPDKPSSSRKREKEDTGMVSMFLSACNTRVSL